MVIIGLIFALIGFGLYLFVHSKENSRNFDYSDLIYPALFALVVGALLILYSGWCVSC